MNSLREKKQEKKQEKLRKENLLLPPRACEAVGISLDDIKLVVRAIDHGITRVEIKECAAKVGMTADEVNAWLDYMDAVGFRYKNGDPVNGINFRRSLRMWHRFEVSKRDKQGQAGRGEIERATRDEIKLCALIARAKVDTSLWELCRERCGNAVECGCRCGVAVPPDKQQPRPFAPEECEHFKAKEV